MELAKVASLLGVEQCFGLLSAGWQESQGCLPEHELVYLTPDYITDACRQMAVPEDCIPQVLHTAVIIRENAALTALFWHFHCSLFRLHQYSRKEIEEWPWLEHALGNKSGWFYLLLALSGLPTITSLYHAKNYPESVLRDTLRDVGRKVRQMKVQQDTLGIRPGTFLWLSQHFSGRLFHLTRLHFVPNQFEGDIKVYRHTVTGRVLALAAHGNKYNAQGYAWKEKHGKEPALISTLEEDNHVVKGYPIHPRGHVLATPVELPRNEWEVALQAGDHVLQLHIPTDYEADKAQRNFYDLCGESYRHALRFFSEYFLDKPFKAIVCHSWMFDPVLETMLPPTSNLIRHMNEFYLSPGHGDNSSALRWVFGKVPDDLSQAPRDTSLRRAMLDYLLAGNELNAGSAFLLREHIGEWGNRVYLSQAQ